MGSGVSEVSESTTVVLLEAATFVGPNNRRTAAALKKRTEASQRFEKGLRADLAMAASKRAMKLLLETGGGTADAGHVDAFPGDGATVQVEMARARLTQVLGVEVDEARVVAILASLGFVVRTSDAAYSVDVPYWRSDVQIADEETAYEVTQLVVDPVAECAALAISILPIDLGPCGLIVVPIRASPRPHRSRSR